MKRLALLLLALTSPAWGQGVLFTAQALTAVQVNGVQVLAAQPSAKVSVCQLSPSGCEATTVYSDEAMTQPLTQPFLTDALGNIVFWAPAANYQYTFCPVSSGNCYTYAISGGAPAVCTSTACNGVLLSAPTGGQAITQPAGTTLSVLSTGTFSGTFSQPTQFLQNGMTQAMMEAMQGTTAANPMSGSLADVATCGQLVPGGATVDQANCYSAFQLSGSTTPTVGYYAHLEPAITGANLWGGLENISDTDDVTGTTYPDTTIFGHEIEMNVASTSTAGAALIFGSVFRVQPSNIGGIHVALPNMFATYPHYWDYGLLTDDGSVTGCAICRGTALPTVAENATAGAAASASQYDQYVWRDSTGADHASVIDVDDTGTYTISSQNGVDIPVGDLTIDNGAYSNQTVNASMILGSPSVANTPSISFFSSGNGASPTQPYDVQIQATGGTAVQGQGTLSIQAAQVIAPGLVTTQATPASSSSPCTAGAIWSDATFIYVCVATNTIKRAVLTGF